MAKIGLVTVLFNSDSVLEGFFKSLSSQTFKDYHLYLIDNTPSPEVDDLINRLLKRYSVTAYTHIKNTSNVGVAKGNNQGIELSRSAGTSYTLLLNNDIEFSQPDLLEKMYSRAVYKGEGLIVPKILYYDTRLIWMAGGHLPKYRGSGTHVGYKKADSEEYSKDGYFTYAPTCFMLISNKVFDIVGIMDEDYFAYYDDTDFVYRALKKGYKILLMASLIVLHKVSSSTGGDESDFAVYYLNRNKVFFMRKNLKSTEFYFTLTLTVLSRLLNIIRYKKNKRKKMLEGFYDGFKSFNNIKK